MKRLRSQKTAYNLPRELYTALGHPVFREFNTAFALMSLIPLLITVYVLAARVFTIQVFEGHNGLLFFIAIIIALLGFLVGRSLLQRILGQLVEANLKLKQYEAMKSAFIANIVHDLNSPLAAVRMSLENLSDGLLGPISSGQKEAVHNCQEILGRMSRVGTDLLDVAGVGKTNADLHREVFVLQELIREALKLRSAYLEMRGLTLRAKLPPQSAFFFGDREKFLQAIGSLIDHAVSRSPREHAVSVELISVPGELRLLVSHDVDAAPQEKAMAAGVSPPAVEADTSFGLDLELAKQIIGLHRGQLWVDSTPEGSVQLVVSLPALETRESAKA